MTKHRSTRLVKDAADQLFTKGVDMVATDLAGPVMTVELRTPADIVRTASRTASGSVSIYTTPTDKDFYLCSVALTYGADAACDNTFVTLNGSVDGIGTVNFLTLAKPSLVAGAQSTSLSFPKPIKVQRGTPIQITSTFGAGACTFQGQITGFTWE